MLASTDSGADWNRASGLDEGVTTGYAIAIRALGFFARA